MFVYTYQYKDHLGNIRLSFADRDKDGKIDVLRNNTDVDGDNDKHHEIKEVKDYYPFGLQINYGNNSPNSLITGRKHNYGFQGEEVEEELDKNTIAYQWRDYDPAIARFNKIDRFAEKYQSLNLYHFSANNPIFFREIAGDSINVTDLYRKNRDGSYINKSQVKAFEFFANTKVGKKYLSQFASKGQEIAGVNFGSDGKYHEGGIDLNFGGNPSGTNSGDTGVGDNNNREPDDNGRFQINVNLSKNESDDYEHLLNIVHETFIHVDRDAKDIMDNRRADHSIVDKDIINQAPQRRHHYQEGKDVRRKNSSQYGTKGYQILKQGNAKYKRYENDNKVWNSMWEFVY